MKLIFHDRSVSPVVSLTDALLTIERKGNFSLSTGAVAGLHLKPESQLVLVEDAETNTWYLLLAPLAGQQPFSLKPRDSKSSKALMFCCQPQAKAYYQAHGLLDEKSVRAVIGLTPVHHEGLALYPLAPQHATPAICAPIPTAETPAPGDTPTDSTPAPARPLSMFTAEMDEALLDPDQLAGTLSQAWNIPVASLYARRSYLKKKVGETTATKPAAAPVAKPELVYTPAPAPDSEPVKKTFGLQARAQELTSYWLEREISRTTPGELAEILNLMRHVPAGTRGIEMQLVLDRAETEQAHRQTAAGKGGNRG
jgi:hypothetical protein